MSNRNYEQTKYFVLTFCVAFVLLSAVAVAIGASFNRRMEAQEPPESAIVDDYYTPSEADNLNMLLIGKDTPNSEAQWFFLVRLDAVAGSIPVAVLPPTTRLAEGSTLASTYQAGGAQAVCAGVSAQLELPVDRYAVFTGESLVQTVNLLGYIGYDLPQTLQYEGEGISIHLAAGRQQVDGQVFYDIVRYPAYQNEASRSAELGQLLSAYLSAQLPLVLEERMDALFQEAINWVQSDLRYVDYDSRREALQFMAKLSGEHAYHLSISGVETPQAFTLADDCLRQLQKAFRPLGGTALPTENRAN